MMSKATLILILNILLSVSVSQSVSYSVAQAEPTREFVLSCSYGALAGTLVGAASLAFSDKPGDNLNRIARGASIGLYGGIALGLFVIYGVSSDDDVAQNHEHHEFYELHGLVLKPPQRTHQLALVPFIGERGLEGGMFNFGIRAF
jgi:hypothetical protein